MRESVTLQQALLEEYRSHRPLRPEDLLKMVYQNEFGCGHLIDDPQHALSRLIAEEAALTVEGRKGANFTPIGNGLARLHLRAVRKLGLHITTLHRFFLLSAREERGSEEMFLAKAGCLRELCYRDFFAFSAEEMGRLIEEWKENGCKPFSHSPLYRRAWNPAYRVVEQRFCDYLPLFAAIDRGLQEKERLIVSIDGNCGAGKTTLAATLQEVYDCTVIPADDFFLQPHQRTEERLKEAGGNLDRERLLAEVLYPLRQKRRRVAYRPYDCGTGKLAEVKEIPDGRLFVVEGSYSQHRDLAPMYDLTVFCAVSPAEQLRRIRARSGQALARRFEEEWIPMENRYFTEQKIREKSDMVFDTD